MLSDSLRRLDASPPPPILLSFLIDTISFSSFEFSCFRAFLDYLWVSITACLLSSYCWSRVAERFNLVMFFYLMAYFLIKTVFSSSIWRLFISRILLLCYSSLSISAILAFKLLIKVCFLLSSYSSFWTPLTLTTA